MSAPIFIKTSSISLPLQKDFTFGPEDSNVKIITSLDEIVLNDQARHLPNFARLVKQPSFRKSKTASVYDIQKLTNSKLGSSDAPKPKQDRRQGTPSTKLYFKSK